MTKQSRRYLEFLNGMGVSINLDRVRVSLGVGRRWRNGCARLLNTSMGPLFCGGSPRLTSR